MEGVTLLQSGATRAHFALVKRLEGAKSAGQADDIVLTAIKDVKDRFTSKHAQELSEDSLSSQLLVILHSLQVYPHAVGFNHVQLDLSFTLVPALHLLATAQRARGLQIAYDVLNALLGPSAASDIEQSASALLLLNTVRQHLSGTAQSHGRRGMRLDNTSPSLDYACKHFALRSISSGTPSGPDVVPALYGPVFSLLSHEDENIQSLAIEALVKLDSYRQEEEDEGVAKATWERIHDVVTAELKRHGKSKAGSFRDTRGEGLQRALLKAAGYALSHQALSVEDYIDVLLHAGGQEASLWLDLAVVRDLQVTVSRCQDILRPEVADKIASWINEKVHKREAHLSFLLAASDLCGSLSKTGTSGLKDKSARSIWALSGGHLLARNANRKALALRVLDAMLPFGWASPKSADDIHLDEKGMAALMDMLKDGDAMIRLLTLQLFDKIDVSMLQGHLNALQAAIDGGDRREEVEELITRSAEVLGILCQRIQSDSLATLYAPRLATMLLSKEMDAVLSEQIVSRVVADWRRMATEVTVVAALEALIRSLSASGRDLSPTSTLLLANLVCELLDPSAEPELMARHAALLDQLVSLLPLVGNDYAPLQEALLIAIAKIAILSKPADVNATLPRLEKYAESVPASLVKQRVRQISNFAHDDRSNELFLHRFGGATLLATLDKLDAYSSSQSKGSSSAGFSNKLDIDSSRKAPRPLQYNAYNSPPRSDRGIAASPSSSSYSPSRKGPFTTMPKPSEMRGEIVAKQQRHEATERAMQQSIAHMTLHDRVAPTAAKTDKQGQQDEDTTEVSLF